MPVLIVISHAVDIGPTHECLIDHHSSDPDGESPVSQLWHTISTTNGPLRLSWPRLQLWARADQKAARTASTTKKK